MSDDDPMLTTPEAARYLRLAVGTLNNYRSWSQGPTYVKLGRAVRYRKSALDSWAAERERRAWSY